MPVRATKRGADRTALDRDCDVLICGASFAGLAVARELEGAGADVLIVDRYDVGERQTSACAAPTEWLDALGLAASIRQTFDELVIHTPQDSFRYRLPWTFSTFDYPELCALLRDQSPSAGFETAKVETITTGPVHVVTTDRGDLRAPLVVDGLGWRRVLAPASGVQPPEARLSRGLEVHPHASGEDLEIWIDRRYIRAGVGSFEPRDHVKAGTLRLAGELDVDPVRYQGNWIPHQLRPAVEDGVFFCGDSAGHCLPLTAEGIRTALYFGIALGRELRLVCEGRQTREQALDRYGAFSAEHAWQYRWLLNAQHLVGRLTDRRLLSAVIGALGHGRLIDWSFNHYLEIAPPAFALAGGSGAATPPATHLLSAA